MAKIITRPQEIEKNQQVLYAGNHYISVPEIDCTSGRIKNINLVSLSNKALVEVGGEEFLMSPVFYRAGGEVKVEKVDVAKEQFYIARITFYLADGTIVVGRVYADLREKGLVYDFESSEEVEIELVCDLRYMNLLRFNSYRVKSEKVIHIDKWLGNPVLIFTSAQFSFGTAFGGAEGFTHIVDGEMLRLRISCGQRNAFYISVNSDADGASTTLIHLRRKSYQRIYQELVDWLKAKTIAYPMDMVLERKLNENLFFNYFFAVSKDMESDRYIALTSRSPRYYVSGAFWERDSFLWSMPAVRLIDEKFQAELVRELILTHYQNAGDHAHYIDGTVLYPGYELDEAASYFIVIDGQEMAFFDEDILQALERVLTRIEEDYDEETGLYKTFLLPSDDPADQPLVTIDNVILWQGLQNYLEILLLKGKQEQAELVSERIEGIRRGICRYLVREVDGKEIFLWSTDGRGEYRLYNDPPGNLGLLYYYGFVEKDDEIFKNTIEYYYSSKYEYFFADAKFRELACDHHPNTPSGLGLCGTLLNPLKTAEALEWVKEANMDFGLLCESFDCYTGEGKTGVGFATGAGYLAYALYYVLIKERWV